MTSDPTSGSETIPQRLRRLMRTSELSVVALAAVVGVLAGLVVIAMNAGWQLLHELIFRIPSGGHLSITTGIPPALVLLGPTLGGLLFGLASWWLLRGSASPVDPIEANALHGGRMSLKDSLVVAVQTLFSSGVGASVGMEAGYTQAGGGLASFLGRVFRVRRARSEAAGLLRRRRGHRRGVQRAADGRLLRLRTDPRHLCHPRLRADDDGELHRRPHPAGAGAGRPCAAARSRRAEPRRPAGGAAARRRLRAGRHRGDARGDAGRGRLPPLGAPRLPAAGGGRADRRHAGAVEPGRALGRPRRGLSLCRRRRHAGAGRAASGRQGHRLLRLHRLGLPRRPVLRLAADGRAGRTRLCRRAGAACSPTWCPRMPSTR